MVSSCLLIASSIGLCMNSVGIFFTPVAESLGIGRGEVAMHSTLSGIAAGLISPLVVKLYDKYSTKLIASIGVVVTVAITALMSFVQSAAQLNLLGAARGCSFSFFAMVPVSLMLNNWFEKKQGLVMGIVFSFSGIGGAIFNSVLSLAIEAYGWRTTYLIVAAMILVLALPSSLLIHISPEKIGRLAYGSERARVEMKDLDMQSSKNTKILASASFILLSVFAVFATFTTGMGQFLPDYAVELGRGLSLGATMLSVAMIGNITFKFMLGALSDKLGPIKACATMLSINVIGFLIMIFLGGKSEILLLASAFLYGAIYSICAVGIPLLTRHIFGTENYGYAYGYITLISNLGGAIPFAVIGFMYDIFSTYFISIVLCVALNVINLLMLMVLKRRRNKLAS